MLDPTLPHSPDLLTATTPEQTLRIWIDRPPPKKPKPHHHPLFLHKSLFTIHDLKRAEAYAHTRYKAARAATAALQAFKTEHYDERIPNELVRGSSGDVTFDFGMATKEPEKVFGWPGWPLGERYEMLMRSLVRRIVYWRAWRAFWEGVGARLRGLIDGERRRDGLGPLGGVV